MGLFGKVFDKKVCSICGCEIGLLGNRRLDDGNLCKACAKKLSPWFEERRHSTVEQIRQQLAYREQNKAAVQAFHVTREFAGDGYHVYIDDSQGKFAIARNMNVETNPDIVDFSQITTCRLEVKQDRDEEKYRDNEGKMQSFNPPRYSYSYDYYIKIGVNSPWFDDMDFQLNTFSVKETDRARIMQLENTGNQIMAALGGVSQNIYSQPPNINQGMYNQQSGINQQMYGQPPMSSQEMARTPGVWICACGAHNIGKFCEYCGNSRP